MVSLLITAVTVVAQAEPNLPAASLDQGWNAAQREWFYNEANQGSHLIPYDWFVNLELPGTTKLLADPKHLDELRFIVDPNSETSGATLPIGFVTDPKPDDLGRAWMGLTCAACHTAQITYKSATYRIDGAPAQADIQTFLEELTKSLRSTLNDEQAFDRFAAKVIQAGTSLERRKRKASLRDQLKEVVVVREDFDRRNSTKAPQRYGFARVDAIGIIFNQVHKAIRARNDDQFPADAPVSYPFLWDTPQHDFVQWNGVAPNRPLGTHFIGPLARNIGEVLGVFGEIEIPDNNEEELKGYRTSVQRENLILIEELLKSLKSPKWPADIPFQAANVANGKLVYQKFCISCHQLIDRDDPNREVTAKMIPLSEAKTDPRMANNFLRIRPTGVLEGRKKFFVIGDDFEAQAPGGDLLSHLVAGTIIRRPFDRFGPVEQIKFLHVLGPSFLLDHVKNQFEKVRDAFDKDDEAMMAPLSKMFKRPHDDDPPAYKARSLNGIWATAPYLHNGSVPNLAQLLLPAEKRVSHFWVGSREFDPVNVGFACDSDSGGAFEFRTTDHDGKPIPGNSNAGHSGDEYGSNMSETDRKDLLAYLETL